jgi:hypothetical protein
MDATQTQADTDKRAQQARANTILHQLGGRRFIAMTGARNIMHDAGALIFSLPGRTFTRGGINKVKIGLKDSDLYDMTFSKINHARCGTVTVKEVSTASDVYADKLQSVFAEATGLDTHL